MHQRYQYPYIPSKLTSTRFNQAWCNRDVRRLSRRKIQLIRKLYNQTAIWLEPLQRYKKVTQHPGPNMHVGRPTTTSSEIRLESLALTAKKLHTYIKGKKCDWYGVSPLKKDGVIYSDPTDQVEILNSQFANASTRVDCTSLPQMGPNLSKSVPLHPLIVQEKGVKKLLDNQNPPPPLQQSKWSRPDYAQIPKENGAFYHTSSNTHI